MTISVMMNAGPMIRKYAAKNPTTPPYVAVPFQVACRITASMNPTTGMTTLMNPLLDWRDQPNPIPVKWIVHRMGLTGAGIRLPLTP